MAPPKPHVTALTGGYRGTPILQVGCDLYIDSLLISEEAERRVDGPTLFPGGPGGLDQTFALWSDVFFFAGLHLVVHELSDSWDPSFRDDREGLFAQFDFEDMKKRFAPAAAEVRLHASLIERQLADGHPFLGGPQPSLADIQAFSPVWLFRVALGGLQPLLEDLERLPPWEARMAELGEGARSPMQPDEAHAVARAATSTCEPWVDPKDPLGLAIGDAVEVAPQTSKRGAVAGNLVRLTADRVALRPRDATIDTVVHFPRLGYEIQNI